MTTFRFDEAFVAIVALAVVVWIGLRLRRGLHQDWLPIGKGQVLRQERPAAFHALFAFYVVAALAMAFIGLDLLFAFTGSR